MKPKRGALVYTVSCLDGIADATYRGTERLGRRLTWLIGDGDLSWRVSAGRCFGSLEDALNFGRAHDHLSMTEFQEAIRHRERALLRRG